MKPSNVFTQIAAIVAAANIGRRRKSPAKAEPKPVAKVARRRGTKISADDRKALAFSAFPNQFGNYLGKRQPKPAPIPLTPEDRFGRLWSEHEVRARPYRWKAQAA